MALMIYHLINYCCNYYRMIENFAGFPAMYNMHGFIEVLNFVCILNGLKWHIFSVILFHFKILKFPGFIYKLICFNYTQLCC